MTQIFHPSFNTLSRFSIFGAVFVLCIVGWVLATFFRSSYATGVDVAREQPVQFSHEHHVRGLGIDCRYCHTSVEESSFAGIPPTETCMTCHAQIWSDSPKLAPVRESYRTGEPIEWNRVHDVPDFVYFDHSIHVAKGIGCASCHGDVDAMPLTWKNESLHMEWCLNCHRNPEEHVRPRNEVFNLHWHPPTAEETELDPSLMSQQELAEAYRLEKLTNCSVCHR